MPADAPTCPSEHRLDQRALGELPTALAQEIEAHLTTCAHCQARLLARDTERQSFVVDVNLLKQLRAPPPREGAVRRRRPTLWLTASVAAAAALLVVLSPGPAEEVAIKGSRASLFVNADNGVHGVPDGASLHPGDVLQIAITSAAPLDIAVVARDGAGASSVYVGESGFIRVDAGARVPLPQATRLDDVLGAEIVAVVLCPPGSSISAQQLHNAPTQDVPGCSVERHAFTKVPR